MLIETLLSSRLTRLLVLLISILTQVILLAFLTHFTPAPRIETTFGGASAEIIADRSWTILPGQCASITWKLEGIQSLYIDGQGAIGWGELKYCPGLFTTGPQFEVTASDGTARIIPVDIHYLLSVLAFAAGFSGMISVLTMAMYYAVKFHYDIRFPVWGMTIVVLALILIGELIALSSYKILIREFLSTLQSLFASRGWHLFGALLAGLIFLPLVFHASRQAIRSKAMQDLVAIGSFLLFVLLLYLPFGFESIAQFEDWVYHSWLDGHAFDFMTRELTLRFWEIVPHTLAHFINSDSFVPLHLVNFLILWSRMVMLYGILRHLNVNRLYAFLVTMLFMVYPVNSALMSLRSLPWQFSSTALLAAVYLMLTFRAAPSRLRLLGIWLCLIFSIGANEAGYVLILVIPLLWCLRDRPMRWKPFNLTVLWYLFPAFKVVYLLLLLLNNVSFHNDWLLDGSRTWLQRTGASIVETGIYHVLNVYRVTFLEGWQVAWTALQQKSFVPVTAFMLLLVGTVSWYLLLQSHQEWLPSPRQLGFALLSGLLFIVPALGVLIWIEKYNSDPWRLYFYVPIGAAIAVFSLIALLTLPIAKLRLRSKAVVLICILLMVPAVSRLLLQHATIVEGANKRAWILAQVLEQAPYIDRRAHLILLTDMTTDELHAQNIYEISRSYLLYRMLHVLNPDGYPTFASFCQIGSESKCRTSSSVLVNHDTATGFEFNDLLVFRLYNDLSVQLLDVLPAEFGFTVVGEYGPNSLYNPDAPIPPRALTMLASARRAFANP